MKYNIVRESTANHKRMRTMLRNTIGDNPASSFAGTARSMAYQKEPDLMKNNFLIQYAGAEDPYSYPGFFKNKKGKWQRIGSYDKYDNIYHGVKPKEQRLAIGLVNLLMKKAVRQNERSGGFNVLRLKDLPDA